MEWTYSRPALFLSFSELGRAAGGGCPALRSLTLVNGRSACRSDSAGPLSDRQAPGLTDDAVFSYAVPQRDSSARCPPVVHRGPSSSRAITRRGLRPRTAEMIDTWKSHNGAAAG